MRICSGILIALALAASASAATAQMGVQVWEPERSLANLVSGERDRLNAAANVISAAFGANYGSYSAHDRRVLLDGVERVARDGASTDGLRTVRSITSAFSMLRTIATDTFRVAEDREIPGRVLRIYAETQRADSRGLAISLMGSLLPRYPAMGRELERELFAAASAPVPSTPGVHPERVIDALLNAGEAGKPLLRRLHEEKAIKDAGAAVYLRELAKNNYTPRGRRLCDDRPTKC